MFLRANRCLLLQKLVAGNVPENVRTEIKTEMIVPESENRYNLILIKLSLESENNSYGTMRDRSW